MNKFPMDTDESHFGNMVNGNGYELEIYRIGDRVEGWMRKSDDETHKLLVLTGSDRRFNAFINTARRDFDIYVALLDASLADK